ncbi:hypothetical protein ANRL3_00713 [Anaerolineae bacterium]|nr:hypothetical protein ANRL3_00713 [Anaerolineae bacterium]
MEETAPDVNAIFPRKVRPAIDIAALTVITMIIVFLLSEFSFLTASAVGSFAGFSMAAWNWLRMGRRRKALAHCAAGFGVYILILVISVLIAFGLTRLFVRSVPTTTEWPEIPGVMSARSVVTDVVQNGLVPAAGRLLFVLVAGALAVVYLYKATARDVSHYQPASDKVEFQYLLPFVGVAVISAVFIFGSTVFLNQIPVAQFQNHVYCEVLQPGQSLYEVSQALNKLGTNDRLDVRKGTIPYTKGVSYYQVVFWLDDYFETRYDLSLRLGFNSESKLASIERRLSDFSWSFSKVITCPWTIFNSLTAR